MIWQMVIFIQWDLNYCYIQTDNPKIEIMIGIMMLPEGFELQLSGIHCYPFEYQTFQ